MTRRTRCSETTAASSGFQQIPIVFAGANLSAKDLRAEVTSVDIMPTILRAMGIKPTYAMDGTAYTLPRTKR